MRRESLPSGLRTMPVLRLLPLAVLAAVVCLAWPGTATSASRGFQPPRTGPQARRAALLDARARLESFRVPPGSERLAGPPAGSHLGAPPNRPEAHKLIDLTRFWQTADSPSEVLRWLRLHHPTAAGLTDEGPLIFEDRMIEHVFSFRWRELEPLARERIVLVTVVPTAAGGSVLRIDSQAEWKTPHPRAERIPPGAGFLKLERITYKPKEKVVIGLTDRREIRAIAALINGLPIVGPWATGHEERLTGELDLKFRQEEGGRVLATVRLQTTPHFGYSVEVTIPKPRHSNFVDHRGGHRLVDHLAPIFAAG
jgi:hypothetical protein